MTRLLAVQAALFLGLTILPPAARAAGTDAKEPAWILNPDTVAAGQAFSLEALSYRYSCAHVYGNQSVTVSGNRIDLGFTAAARPEVLCPAVYMAYGPAFKMPALPEGRYTVVMNLLTCQVGEVQCAALPQRESAGILVVGAPKAEVSYILDPASVRAGTGFTLNLLSPEFTCNLEYQRLSSTVQDGRITLTFLDKANPLVRCAPDRKAYGPAYKMPGLAAGTYEVWAERLPACAEQGCKMAAIPQLAGRLTVGEGDKDRRGWFLKQDVVPANTPFTLNLLNNAYGNCHTSFEHKSLVLAEKAITVSFTIETDTSHVCVMDLRPHGPDFKLDGMKPGSYPVAVQVMPACAYNTQSCLPVILLPAPEVVDTLVVSRDQALGLGGAGSAGRGPRAVRQGGGLRLMLPEGASGTWRAEVLDLSGRRLQDVRVEAGRGAALLPLAAVDAGLVLVRLTGPGAGQRHLLRVPVAAGAGITGSVGPMGGREGRE